jgi:hypothetical protein
MSLPRLRQLVLASRDLPTARAEIELSLGLLDPFRDEGVAHFGLRNAVYALGDTFIEVVSPQRGDTAAGRHIDRRGGDCGYMVMFEVADAAAVRQRLTDLGIRTIWDTTHDDIVDLHLHPKDVGAAIVALDVATPVGSWRWGGPAWTARVPRHGPGGLRSLTVGAVDPAAACQKWAAVLDAQTIDSTSVELDGGRQRIIFVTVDQPQDEGIIGVEVEGTAATAACDIAGVRFQPVDATV